MKLRQLVTASGLYGIADMLVVAVSGFLLLPLYTRTLTQDQFGAYVIVRTNTEILGYVLYLGLISAVSRLYFDHREQGAGRDYLNSVLMFFLAVFVLAAGALALFGEGLWRQMSPDVPAEPYLWYTMALVGAGFLAQLGALWLRLETRVKAFVTLQVFSAGLLAIAAWIALVPLELGLPGLLIALLIGNVPAGVMLLHGIGKRLRPTVDRASLGPSLSYGLPFAVSYIAYFVLNRFSLVTLQHHVALDEIAVFGLAQQIGLIIAIGSQSFGKAMQPAVFGAAAGEAPEVLRRSSKLFILLIFGLSAGVILFARELLWLIAPGNYQSGFGVVLLLLVGNFVYALSLVSGTTLDYHRKPRVQAGIYILGALAAVGLGLLLVPRYGLMGGAVATLGAYLTATLAGHLMAYRVSRQAYFAEMAVVTAALVGLAALAAWPGWTALPFLLAVPAKLIVAGAAFGLLAAVYTPQRFASSLAWLRARFTGAIARP